MKISKETSPWYSWGEQCIGYVLVDTPGLSVKQELMPPMTTETVHYHNKAQQFFYIIRGTAAVSLNGIETILIQGSGIHILPSEKHFIQNRGDDDLEFLVISQPSTNDDRVTIE